MREGKFVGENAATTDHTSFFGTMSTKKKTAGGGWGVVRRRLSLSDVTKSVVLAGAGTARVLLRPSP